MTSKNLLLSISAVIFSFISHEFSHWILGECLGNEMRMTLNTVYPISREYIENWHYPLVSAIGPIVTLLQSVICFSLIKRTHNANLFFFLFTAFYIQLLAGIMNVINPNDLGRIGQYLGIGLFTLPIIFTAIHACLLHFTIKREAYSRRMVLIALLFIMVFSSIWILSNQYLHIVLI